MLVGPVLSVKMPAMTASATRTRFAPSPTGHLHLGNVRTALFNYLLARAGDGRFLLRIEDTDQQRSQPAFVAAVQDDLRWLGMDWDEGPGTEGGPWQQSAREAVYAEHYDRLEQAGRVYPCFCSAAELERSRQRQMNAGRPPRYDGKCAGLDVDEARRRLAAGEPAAWRFRVPPGEQVKFTDMVRGEQVFASDDIGDFIVRRTDGTPAFFFCNALDDALMGVTHVLRGEDHVTNTPRQIMLLEALELPQPVYGHMGLLVGEDGAPLSKRHGRASLDDLRVAGYLPVAVLNALARLGHTLEEEALLSLEALARHFDVSRLGRSPARFDDAHLRHWQRLAAHALAPDALLAWLGEAVAPWVAPAEQAAFLRAVQPNVLFPEDAARWAEIVHGDDPSPDAALGAADTAFFSAALAAFERHGPDVKAMAAEVREATGAKGRGFFHPLRLALTGVGDGPDFATLFDLLPTTTVTRRLQRCAL